jgi:hypothetical protein
MGDGHPPRKWPGRRRTDAAHGYHSGTLLRPTELGQIPSLTLDACQGSEAFRGEDFTITVSWLPQTIANDPSGYDAARGVFNGTFGDWAFSSNTGSISASGT